MWVDLTTVTLLEVPVVFWAEAPVVFWAEAPVVFWAEIRVSWPRMFDKVSKLLMSLSWKVVC